MKEKVVNSISEVEEGRREERKERGRREGKGKMGDLGERFVNKNVADDSQGSSFSHPQWGKSGRKMEGGGTVS